MEKKRIKLVFRGKEYQSFSECYKDNRDIARISIPTFAKRVREGKSIEEALTSPKGRTLSRIRLASWWTASNTKICLQSRGHTDSKNRSFIAAIIAVSRHGAFSAEIQKKLRSAADESEKGISVENREQRRRLPEFARSLPKIRRQCRHIYQSPRQRYSVEQSLGLEPISVAAKSGKIYEIDGEKYTLTEVGKKFKINLMTFLRRLDTGLSPKEAATMKPLKRSGIKK